MERGNTNASTIIFAVILCLVSSTALTLVSKGLEPQKNLNVELDRKSNVLKAFGVNTKNFDKQDVSGMYRELINEYVVERNGSIVEGKKPADLDPEKDSTFLPVYEAVGEDSVKGYAIPIVGYGLWSWMYGYFALEKDLKTVKGITFYKHGETPGLGGEIEAQWFQENFEGKKIYGPDGKLRPITVVKGKVEDVVKNESEQKYYVDGISGATMTSNGVTRTIEEALEKYAPHFEKLKGRV
ncbi:MAG: NADH:ubiquinone reductase (Na(+)-transporting) subunit C [Chitinivibrionales bacterium]|nr:NADH:ubiquinone reductase (Na(+)-transporting) subunit C [Chitinivibrionales bacterium]